VSDAPVVPMDGASPDQIVPGDGGMDVATDGMTDDSGPLDPTWTLPLDVKSSFTAVTVDTMGNVFVAGSLSGALTLDGLNIASTQGDDVFIMKLDGVTKKAVWMRTYGGAGSDAAWDLAFDNGLLFMVGTTDAASATFGNTTLQIPPSSNGVTTSHSWIARIDPSNGAVIWAVTPDQYRTANTAHFSTCAGIAARGGKLSVSCAYGGANFGVTTPYAASTNNTGVAVLRLQNGFFPNPIWTKSLTTVGTASSPHVTIDANDDTWITGMFSGAAFFDNEKMQNVFTNQPGPNNLYALKIPDGTQTIAPTKSWSAAQTGILPSIAAKIVVTPMSVYVAGGFGGTGSFPGGSKASSGAHDAYFLRFGTDLSLGTQTFAGGAGSEIAWSLVPLSTGEMYTAFSYGSTGMTFGQTTLPDPPQTLISSAFGKLDAMGKPVLAKPFIAKTSTARIQDMRIFGDMIYAVGIYGGDTTFDDGTMKLVPVQANGFFARRKPF
jgi:hypothetical protein